MNNSSNLTKNRKYLSIIFLATIQIAMATGLSTTIPTSVAQAAITLPQLNQANLDAIENDMAANTLLHDALPPSSMGSIFGFEVGLVAGTTKSPGLNTQVQSVSSSTSAPAIPHAGLVAAVTIPFGITFEAVYLPKLTIGDLTYQQYAGAVKWTFTDGWVLPVNIAARGFLAKSTLSFVETFPSTSIVTTISNDTSVQGVQLLASPKLIPIIEPYVGVGMITATGTLSSSAAVSIFSFTSALSASSSLSTTQLLAGLDIRALLFGFGIEWSRAFGNDSYTGKLSLKF